MSRPRTRGLATSLGLLLLLVMLYALSYAPAYRFHELPRGGAGERAGWQLAYRPVEWLIDRTPLSGLLLKWGDLWGVGGDLQLDSRWRLDGITRAT